MCVSVCLRVLFFFCFWGRRGRGCSVPCVGARGLVDLLWRCALKGSIPVYVGWGLMQRRECVYVALRVLLLSMG